MSKSNQNLCFVTFNLNSKPVLTIQRCIQIDENDHLTFAVNGKIFQLKQRDYLITPGNSINQLLKKP